MKICSIAAIFVCGSSVRADTGGIRSVESGGDKKGSSYASLPSFLKVRLGSSCREGGCSCTWDSDCDSGLCSWWKCKPKVENGGSCGADEECASGMCDSGYKCSDKRQIGENCVENDDCASRYCDGSFTWLTGGKCAKRPECTADDHCKGGGESLTGAMPKAFCVEERCSVWKRGKPIDQEGYPVKKGPNDQDLLWVKRNVYDSEEESFEAASLVWHFDMNNQMGDTANKFEANATHVRVPTAVEMLGGYSMNNHAIQEHETGILSAIFGHNPYSVITDRPDAGVVEKYHTLTYDGEMDSAEKQRIESELQARVEKTQKQSIDSTVKRTYLQSAIMSLSDLAAKLVEAQQDVAHLNQIRDFVDKGGNFDKSSSGSQQAKAALDLAAKLPSLKSNNHCSHFEKKNGMRVTDSHVEIPLNSPIVIMKGTSEFVPSLYIGVMSGVLIVDYDEESKILEFHFKASQFGRAYINDSSSPKHGLHIAPVSENHPVSPQDGRTDEYYETEYNLFTNTAFKHLATIPIDYSYFDRSPTGTCDKETKDMLKPLWKEVQIEIDPESNMFSKLANKHKMSSLISEGGACASSYMKTDGHANLNGMGWTQYIVWAHFILEQSPNTRELICTSTWWDDWDEFYKKNSTTIAVTA